MNKQYNFGCECCKYYTNIKKCYDVHTLSKTHLLKAQNKFNANFECTFCKKSFQTSSGLWKHNKTCNVSVSTVIINKTFNKKKVNNENDKVDISKLKENFDKVLLKTEENYNKQIEALCKEKENLRENILLRHFKNNTKCVYYGTIDNVSNENEKLIKFGCSNNLKLRVFQHKNTYTNFRLINAFSVDNQIQIENAMKKNDLLRKYRRKITINDKNYNEVFAYDNISFETIDKIIQDSIEICECTPENYKKLLEQNERLKKENLRLKNRLLQKLL